MADILVDNPLPKKSPLLIELQEGNKLWSNEDNVQFWINNISDVEFAVHASETSSPTKSDGDVFLQLPGDYPDDLVLGAEAKHYGHLSPRLSPLCSFDNDDKEVEDNLCDDVGFQQSPVFQFHPSPDHQDDDLNDIDIDIASEEENIHTKLKKHSSTFQDEPFFMPEPSPPKVSDFFSGSLDSIDTFSSFASSFDRPSSLAAALRADPEELLYSLGFCEENSLLQAIPARFFLNESEAYGIDVSEIHMSLMLEDEAKSVTSVEPVTSNPLLHRFSESSIDIQSLTSNDSNNLPNSARTRRILFKSSHTDIPSIHLTGDEDRSLSSPTSTSSGANWMKLETLEEVPEPTSRGSSFELDKTAANQLSSFVNATMHNVRTRLENVQSLDVRRKSSDTNTSHGGTLVDEEDKMSHILNSSLDDAHSLLTPTFYRRCNSDKSVSSSVATVIEQSDYNSDKSSNELDRGNSSTTGGAFKPIHNNSSQDDSTNHNEETRNGNISPSLSAAQRRSLFGNTRRARAKQENDNVFISNESAGTSIEPNHCDSKESDICLRTRITPKTLDEIRRASPNTSFRDFIKQLAAETAQLPANSTPEALPVVVTDTYAINTLQNPSVPSEKYAETSKNPTETFENYTETSENLSIFDRAWKHDSEIHPHPDEKVTETKPLALKKGYFSAAFNSLSNVFSKYNDSKQSACADTIDGTEGDKNRLSSPPQHPATEKKNTPSLFKLFNHHQLLSVHSNSAFSSVATGLATGEVDLDPVSEREQLLLRDSHHLDHKKSTSGNDFSDSSNERHSPLGYTATNSEVSSNDVQCQCSSSNTSSGKRKHNKNCLRVATNRRSCESSGISEDQQREIKCPLGKNCSLRHMNGQHVYPSNNSEPNRLAVRSSDSSSNSIKASSGKDSPESSSVVQRQPLTHDHFDYLVQQIIAIRGEIKEEFEQSAVRANEFKVHVADQIDEIRKVLSNEYMGWIVKEMKQLKSKLQEKDDEIRRLRDVIIESNSKQTNPYSSVNGTEV